MWQQRFRTMFALTFVGIAVSSVCAQAQGQASTALTLQRAIEMAQQNGPAGDQARESFEAARWRTRAFSGRLLPQISLAGTVPNMNRSIIPVTQPDGSTLFLPQRQTESSVSLNIAQRLPFTGGDLTVISDLSRVDRFGQSDSRLWRSTPVQVSLRQNLLRTNTLAWDRREQSVRERLAERQFLEAMEDVAVTTVGAFFDAYIAEFAVNNAANNVALNDTLAKISEGRYEVGRIGENDLHQAQLASLRAQIALDAAKLQRDRAMGALRIALRLPADAPITLVAPMEYPDVQADTIVAVAEALRNRSQVLDLELQATQARRRVSDTKRGSGIGATLNASAGFNQSSPLLDDAYRALLQQQRFGLSLQVPVFLGGSRGADIQAALSDERRTASGITNTLALMQHDVKFAALEMSQTRRSVASSARADTISQQRAQSAKDRFLIGRIPINDFYQAQSERDNVLQAYMQSLRGYWQAYYRLRRLTLYDFARGERLLRN